MLPRTVGVVDDAREGAREPVDRQAVGQSLPERLKELGSSPATLAFTLVNILVFLAAEWVGSTTDPRTLVRFGASHRSLIWDGELWRFVTPIFLHIGLIHIAVNTWFMFGWCSTVERVFGTGRFIPIYLTAGVGGVAASVLMSDALSAGASGAGFGMIGVYLVILYRWKGSLGAFFRYPGTQSLLSMLALWVFLGATLLPIDNWAHLGGLAFGGALGLAFSQKEKARRLPVAAAVWVALALVVWLAATPRGL